ncbi:MAG: hypothetical protein SPL62_04455 [Selenomonas sp.]|uniref:hypothetical protein n=1 Tax=uncultured Selenomonas sp. TaxID=159275 RepID=UPI0025F47B21|nr:hypothetical protein [uncultured Selenomonas sp.]MDY6349731.1 hypothetical protein [Selenomonas sp.]
MIREIILFRADIMMIKIEHKKSAGAVRKQWINADDDFAAQMAQDCRELDWSPVAHGTLFARMLLSFAASPLFTKASIFPEVLALRVVADVSRFADDALAVYVHPAPEPGEELARLCLVNRVGKNSEPLVWFFVILLGDLRRDDAMVFEKLAKPAVFALQSYDGFQECLNAFRIFSFLGHS